MTRTDIINALIKKHGYTRYLEIGVRKNANFNQIKIAQKDGVDPEYPCSFKMTSDEFFNIIPLDRVFDIVFIDGLHLKEQVFKDITNSLLHLSSSGTIVLHDCNPIKKEHASAVCDPTKPWNGTVWEAFVEFRMTRPDLNMYVVDTDHGCGVISRGQQETIAPQPLTYELLESDRIKILNLISVENFYEITT